MRLLLLSLVFASTVAAQPGPCVSGLDGYGGPCFYGAPPTFFDDFAYSSARVTGSIDDAPWGDLFGSNEWPVRTGTERTRGWYRYNRNDLPVPGTITFESPSTLVLRLPQGLASANFNRSLVLNTGFSAGAGTYAWRARLSELGEGQRLRQSIWTMSDQSYVFERDTADGPERLTYWSELDFEIENHFQGERRDGAFVPDYVSRMSVGNHYGQLDVPAYGQRMGANGIVDGTVGRGALARNGPGRDAATNDAPLLSSWADEWFYFVIDVDEAARVVTYRAIPERPRGPLRALVDERFAVRAAFYPAQLTHPAFSLHWVEPEGRLRRPLSMDVDWLYYSPLAGLSLEDIRKQVQHLRQRRLARLNTTGRPTFEAYDPAQPVGVRIEGPRVVPCGERADWTMSVRRIGRFHVRYRYRVLGTDGTHGRWQDVVSPTFALTAQLGQAGVEVEATAQDLWAPNGVVKGPPGWNDPHPDNDRGQARLTAQFTCGAR